MNRRSFLIDTAGVIFSKAVTLLSSVLIGFLVPKILPAADYGYLKIYSLYAVYTALLHFGFVDGILLKFAGQEYDSLNKGEVRAYSQFFLLFQTGICFLFCLTGLWIPDANAKFILIALGIHTALNNVTAYYQFISQAVQRFREYSLFSVLAALLKAILVLSLLALDGAGNESCSFQRYILLLNLSDALLLGWYVYTYRDITFGPRRSFSQSRSAIRALFKRGIVLTLAYQAAHMVLALDRQLVSVLFSIEIYGVYSFAYSLVNVISQLISSVSTVLFPALKKKGESGAKRYYNAALRMDAIISGAALLGFFPLKPFLQWFLPEYGASMTYLRIILPALMLTSCISAVMFTYYKITGKVSVYLLCGCIALGIGAALNFGCFLFFRSPEAVSWASVLTAACWYFAAGTYFSKGDMEGHLSRMAYIFLLGAAFYWASQKSLLWWEGMAAYFALYCGITAAGNNQAIRRWIREKSAKRQ